MLFNNDDNFITPNKDIDFTSEFPLTEPKNLITYPSQNDTFATEKKKSSESEEKL